MPAAVKHLACLFQGYFSERPPVYWPRPGRKKNAGHKDKRLSNMTWHNSTPDYEFPDPPRRLLDHETPPITASVKGANRNSEFYAFLSQHPRPLSGCCPKLHRLFASVDRGLLLCAGSGAECPARDGTCRRHQGFAFCQRSAKQDDARGEARPDVADFL